MNKLEEFRIRIDICDQAILDALEERFGLMFAISLWLSENEMETAGRYHAIMDRYMKQLGASDGYVIAKAVLGDDVE